MILAAACGFQAAGDCAVLSVADLDGWLADVDCVLLEASCLLLEASCLPSEASGLLPELVSDFLLAERLSVA